MLITTPYDHSRRRMATIGTFDGVHLGHRSLLRQLTEEAQQRGLTPTAVTFTTHPRAAVTPGEAPPMLMSPHERHKALMSAGAEDVIMLPFDQKTQLLSARDFMALLHDRYNVDVLLMGFNNGFGHDRLKGIDAYRMAADHVGVEIIAADELTMKDCPRVCSSQVRTLLQQARPDEAARLLGTPYRIVGRVVHGKELGRTIGYPTANIEPTDPSCLIPAKGVYAASVTLPDAAVYPAMLNIGHRPSVDQANAPISIEAHILGFDGDLYGKTVSVDFLRYIRSEQKFPSLDALRARLDEDARMVHDIFNKK